MRIQGQKSTIEKTLDTDLEYKSKTNKVFSTTAGSIIIKEGGCTSIYAEASPSYQAKEINTYMSCMYMIVISS